MRHYSKVEIETPEPGDEPELVVRIDCDVCGTCEWRTNIVHLGTLMRSLVDAWEKHGGDDGTISYVGDAASESEKAELRLRLNRVFPKWKSERMFQG